MSAEVLEAKNMNQRNLLLRNYSKKYATSPPASFDFETTLTNLKEEKPQIFETQKFQAEETILERNQFWETHQSFRPEKWKTIPLDKQMDSFSHMDFAIEEKLQWEDPFVDPYFEPKKYANNRFSVLVFLLAATRCGKSSTIYRALSKQYGFYFCCDASSKFSQFDDNVITKDYLMDQFYQTMASLYGEQILAFGGTISRLVFISRLLSVYIDCDGEKILNEQKNNIIPTDRTKILTPSQFLKLQTGNSTKKSKEIFLWLLEKNYHHDSFELELLLDNIFLKLKQIFELKKFPIFIDEAQLFGPNEHELLQNKYTCTPFTSPRQNDLYALMLNTYGKIRENVNLLCLIGTTFTGDDDERSYGAARQEIPLKVIVGHSLIETKDDLLKKMKSIMNVTKELAEFIDTSIHEYLPLRRGVFTLACSKILKNNQNNMKSFKKAFDESFEDTKKTIIKKLMNKKLTEREEINVKTLLKFFSLFDVSVFDHTYLGAFLPKKFHDIFIDTGIAPYYTDPYKNEIYWSDRAEGINLDIRFLFREPLCKTIAEELCNGMEFTDNFWKKIFGLLVKAVSIRAVFPYFNTKKNEKNSKIFFDAAFTVILAYLSSKKMKICDLPFCDIVRNDELANDKFTDNPTNFQKQHHKFLESNFIFTVKAAISPKTIKTFLSSNSKDLDAQSKDDLSEILSLQENDDNIYWSIFFKENLFHLLIDVCYLPSNNYHPNCWILSKLTNNDDSLTQNNCGFISFAYELHHEIQEDKFKQNNYRYTFQSSMYSLEKIYSKIENNFPVNDDSSKNPERKDIRDPGFMVPNLPISISLCEDKNFQIHDESRMHAVQITSSSIDKVFTGAYEIIFPNTNSILTSTNPPSYDTSES